jgi:N-acetylglucosaminyl-diphospho-decaprenol L-rhamnosyltransferase
VSHSPLTVVVVHWNRSVELSRSVARLDDQGLDIEIVVVDNGSTPHHLDAARTLVDGRGSRAHLIELGRNTGFGPAANAGFRWWLAERDGSWVALMPHDALPAPGALAAMIDIADATPSLALLSADVGDGATPVVDPYFGGITKPAEVESGFEPADHPHGTLMLAQRRALEEVGVFDERYFAYCEEADLGLRALDAGWQVGLARGVMVENPEMGPGSAAVAYLQLRNTLMLVREHSGLYHATIRMLIGLWQIGRAVVVPASRDHLHHPRARLRAVGDWLRGRTGPPPRSLSPGTSEA